MKKYYFTFLIIFTLIQLSYGQKKIGIKGGLNLSKASIDYPIDLWQVDESYKIGYHIGLFSDFKLNNTFHLAPELLLSEKGTKNLAATYISIPALLNIRISDKFVVEAGPEVDLLLIDGSLINKYPLQMWKKGFSLGLDLGVKSEITEKMIVNLRYNYGLSSVMEGFAVTDERGNKIDHINIFNRNIQLSVGYKIYN